MGPFRKLALMSGVVLGALYAAELVAWSQSAGSAGANLQLANPQRATAPQNEKTPLVCAPDWSSLLAPADDVGWQTKSVDGFVSLQWQKGGLSGLAVRAPLEASGPRLVTLGRIRRWQLDVSLLGAAPAPGQLDHGRLMYRDVFQSTDMILVTDETRFEEIWVLKDQRAPNRFVWRIEPGSGIAGVEDTSDGGVVFYDSLHRSVLQLPAPVATDSLGQTRAVSMVRHGYELSFEIDTNGLQYPVFVDPGLLEVATWTLRTPLTTTPEPRSWHAMAYLPGFDKVIMHGGVPYSGNPFSAPDNLWAWDGQDWGLVNVPDPKPVALVAESLATIGDAVALYGGHSLTGERSADLWVLKGSPPSWDKQDPKDVPPGRSGAMMAPVKTQEAMVVYGGSDHADVNVLALSDAYLLDDDWHQQGTNGGPPVRDGTLLQSPEVDSLVLWGGRNCSTGQCVANSQYHARLGPIWQAISNLVQAPAPRWGMASAYDDTRKRHVIFGGLDNTGVAPDTWEFTGTRWYQRSLSLYPASGAFSAMAFDSSRGYMVFFGGRALLGEPGLNLGEPASSETWTYSVTTGACTMDSECDTGHCVDGACCEVASCGLCESCNTPLNPGYCAPLQNEPDPGLCNTICFAGSCCASGCQGPCSDCTQPSCTPLPAGSLPSTPCEDSYRCDGINLSCPASCEIGGCVPGYHCETVQVSGAFTICVAGAQVGAPCSFDGDCSSEHCKNGVCCGESCGGCGVCSQAAGSTADGTCTAVAAGMGECAEGQVCDGQSDECQDTSSGGSGGTGGGAAGAGGAGTAGTTGSVCPSGQILYSDNRCYDIPGNINANKRSGCDCDVVGQNNQDSDPAAFQRMLVVVGLGLGGMMVRRRRARGTLVFGALGAMGFLVQCSHDLDSDEPCKNAFYAVASRTHACTGDSDLSNDRYEAVDKRYKCTINGEPTLPQFLCASAINNLTCEQVKRYDDDYERWFAASAECSLIMVHADGSKLPTPTGGPTVQIDPNLTANPVCAAAISAMGIKYAQCIGAPGDWSGEILKVFQNKYGCAAHGMDDPQQHPCVRDIPNLTCPKASQAQAIEALRTASPSCEVLFPVLP